MPAAEKPKKSAAPDEAASRFVQQGDEGVTINGMPIDEYLKHPDTQKALRAHEAKAAGKKKS